MTDGGRLEAALEAHDVEAVAALLDGGAGVDDLPLHARWAWARRAPLVVVRAFVERSGVGPGEADADGRTLLHEVAAGDATPEVVAWLLQRDGVDPDQRASDGTTPFFHAAAHGRLDAARLLYDAGADPNTADTWTGWPALVVAIVGGDDDTVAWLIGLDGIDVNRADLDGATPLHHAVRMGRSRAAELLRAAGAVDVPPRPFDPARHEPLGDPDASPAIGDPPLPGMDW